MKDKKKYKPEKEKLSLSRISKEVKEKTQVEVQNWYSVKTKEKKISCRVERTHRNIIAYLNEIENMEIMEIRWLLVMMNKKNYRHVCRFLYVCCITLYMCIFGDSFSQFTLPKSGITYASQLLHPHARSKAWWTSSLFTTGRKPFDFVKARIEWKVPGNERHGLC